MRKIALEEHFITSDFVKESEKTDWAAMKPEYTHHVSAGLLDLDHLRLKAMDEAGIEISVLSLTSPGVQGECEAAEAIALARKTNEFLAEKIACHPDRFRGFATLAMHDPKVAAQELEYCVKELKFVGGLVNGQTDGHYLDEKKYDLFWKKVQELDVPIYLHPGSPLHTPENYKGHHELAGPMWGWGVETGTHFLRLLFAGLFDRFPDLKVILGHMGETIPSLLWRFDSRWDISKQPIVLKMAPSDYIKKHLYVTTSGVCSNGPLLCALQEMGEDHVMFSTDYPYESSEIAAKFIETAPITKQVREKVCYQNAEKLFGLK